MRVLVDADVVLELFINRGRLVEEAEELLMNASHSQFLEVYTTDKCLKRVCSELGETDSDLSKQAVSYVEAIFNGRIITIDSILKQQARESPLRDFDSAIELACATAMHLDAIITQNPQNFEGSNLPIWLLADFLKHLHSLENRFKDKATLVRLPGETKFEIGVYECELHLKFRLIEEKSLLSDRGQLLSVLLDALAEGSDDFLETLSNYVKAEEVSEFKASPQMRRQLIRLRNFVA
jgi:Npun R1517